MGELETEERLTRDEIASYLRAFADRLEGDDGLALELGDRKVRLTPTEPVTFKLEGESDCPEGDTEAKQSTEFELVWRREVRTPEEGTLDVVTDGQ